MYVLVHSQVAHWTKSCNPGGRGFVAFSVLATSGMMMSCGICCSDSAAEVQIPLVGMSALSPHSSSDDSDATTKASTASDDRFDIFGKVRPARSSKDGKAFVATLAIKEDGVGAVFSDYEGRALRVKYISVGGSVFWHNQKSPESEKILVGSLITDVSGASGSSRALRKALDCSGTVDVSVRQPPTFAVEGLSKGDRPLGLCLTRHSRASVLVVKEVQEGGVVAAWNDELAAMGTDIRCGDQITSVNGTAGNIDAMRQLLSASDVLDLVILRPLPH